MKDSLLKIVRHAGEIIRRDRAANYRQTNRGVERSYYAMSEAISSVRMGCAEKMDLAEYLKEDEEND